MSFSSTNNTKIDLTCTSLYCGLLNKNSVSNFCHFCGSCFNVKLDFIPPDSNLSFMKFRSEWYENSTLLDQDRNILIAGWYKFEIGDSFAALNCAKCILKKYKHNQDALVLAVFSLATINDENEGDEPGNIGSQRSVFLKSDKQFIKYLKRLLFSDGDLEWKYAALSWLVYIIYLNLSLFFSSKQRI